MSALESTLIALEEQFWTGGAAFYREHLADDARMVLPSPAGVMDKAQTIDAIASGPRWARVTLSETQVIRVSAQVAILIYRASATREHDASRYSTLATSVYVRPDEAWMLACHQQTPE